MRSDLNILKSQCGARVRDYLLGIVHKITAESNLEELQNSELLGTAEIMLFLKKHIPKTFEEVGKRGNWDVDQAAVRRIGQGNHDEPRQILPRTVPEPREFLTNSLQPHETTVGNPEDPLVVSPFPLLCRVVTHNVYGSFSLRETMLSLKQPYIEWSDGILSTGYHPIDRQHEWLLTIVNISTL